MQRLETSASSTGGTTSFLGATAFGRSPNAQGPKRGRSFEPSLADLTDPYVLLAVLEYHIARGDLRAAGLVNSGAVRLLNEDMAMIFVDGEGAKIENFPVDSLIEAVDIRARNGIAHIMSQVLIPPAAAQSIQDSVASASE